MQPNFDHQHFDIAISHHADPMFELKQDEECLSKIRGSNISPNLRFWSSTSAVIASKRESRLPYFEKAANILYEKGWPVYVRSTGGAVCPLGPGILNLSLVNKFKFEDSLSVHALYLWFCSKLINSFSVFCTTGAIGSVPNCYCDGSYNVVVSGKKLIGTSQRCLPISKDYKEIAALMHATILINTNKEHLCNLVNIFNTITEQDTIVSENSLINLTDVYPSGNTMELTNILIDKITEEFSSLEMEN